MGGKLPVLVWIHGGSNRAGGPNDIVLSDVGKQVVIVGVRYRLGIFGFLSHPRAHRRAGRIRQLRADGSDGGAALGPAQHRQASAAIRATSRSRANPRVDRTSACCSPRPLPRPLFQKAIMESGTPGFGMPFRSLRDAERIGDQADDLLGTGGDLAKMRTASPAALLAVDKQLFAAGTPGNDFVWLRTTVDGSVLPASPVELLKQAPAKPIIVGSNRYEWDIPGGRAYRDQFIAKSFGANEPAARAFYKLDVPAPDPDPRLGPSEGQIATDVTFRCPALRMATIMAAKGAPVWHYEFDGARQRCAQLPFRRNLLCLRRIAPCLGHFAEALLDQLHPQRRSQRRGPSRMAALLRATAASRLVRGRRCDPRSAGPCPGLRIVRRLMMKLTRQYVEKPWGREQPPAMFEAPPASRIGEVWFTGGGEKLPLLAKYIFTSERLSIQVHPDDAQARARGLAAGQERMLVHPRRGARRDARARPHARAGKDELRAAALDGSIEQLIDWRAGSRRRLRVRPRRDHPRHRRGHFAARIPAEFGRHLSPLRLRPAARAAPRRRDFASPPERASPMRAAAASRARRGAHAGRRAALLGRAHPRATLSRTASRWVMPLETGPGRARRLPAARSPDEQVETTAGARLLIGAMPAPS